MYKDHNYAKLESLVEEVQKAVSASRSSLSPAIVKQMVEDIKHIKDKTECIPIMEERQKELHKKVESMNNHSKDIAILQNNQSYIIRLLWGGGTVIIGLSLDLLRRVL